MSQLFSTWYQPAHWPVLQQWFVLLLSSSLLIGGLLVRLSPRWQQYQQLMSETQLLLQQVAALPPHALSQPPRTTVMITPTTPAAALARLLQQISELTEQQELTLLALQQPSVAHQGEPRSTQLTIEVMGSYQSLLNFLIALGTTQHPLAIESLILHREEQPGDVKLTLGLSLAEQTEVP